MFLFDWYDLNMILISGSKKLPFTGRQNAYLATREAVHILRLSLKADQLWAENGQLEAWKTYGSDRRIYEY